MERYKNLSGDSGVVAFEIESDAIEVEFQDGRIYRYTHDITGSAQVEEMKRLAAAGQGLSTFIARYIRDDFESRRP
jgi:hypothetical protein